MADLVSPTSMSKTKVTTEDQLRIKPPVVTKDIKVKPLVVTNNMKR